MLYYMVQITFCNNFVSLQPIVIIVNITLQPADPSDQFAT